MSKIILDGENAIVGRIGSYAAKELLKGNEVVIINAEKAIISGRKENIANRLKVLRKKGGSSEKGPIVSKLPDRLLKRMIRGMLPWDRTKGREAYKRLRCYTGAREKNAKKMEHQLPNKYITIKQLSELV
jgi:large subunit ribosomal protein L13